MLELIWDTIKLQLIMILRPLLSASARRSSRILAGKCEKQHVRIFRPTQIDLDFGALRSVCFHFKDISKHLHQIVGPLKRLLKKSGTVPKHAK